MRILLTGLLWLFASGALALDAATVNKLGFGDGDEKIAAIAALVAEGDPASAALLQAASDGELQTSGKRVLIVKGEEGVDAATGAKISPLPEDREDVILNNRVRRELGGAMAALKLISPDGAARLAAAKELSGNADPAMLPLIKKALARETDAAVKQLLELTQATLELKTGTKESRLGAVRTLGLSTNPNTKMLLLGILEKTKEGGFAEPDEDIRIEAQKSLRAVEDRLAWGERAGVLFTSVSLGSILLLAALGLAITYGLMGVINMAHGELIMVGAYTTYVVQNLFKYTNFFDWYLLAAVPASFLVAAVVGMALERLVIRWLYGRPLETLLATWGISLMLIQTVRTIFGAQNVQVENPAFMSGGVEMLTGVVMPWSRIVIICFAAAVLVAMWLLLTKTRLGLFVRGVTQNRAMASCVGVPTARVDTWAFGLGSGIAGLAGWALPHIGHVGPDLGHGYLVDAFLVAVLGAVGQLS